MNLFWRTAVTKGSIHFANCEGDSGHPCLVPSSCMKEIDGITFVPIVALGEE